MDASDRFDRIAANYANSEVHRSSPSIVRLHQRMQLDAPFDLLDVACGAGHLTLSFVARDVAPRRIVGLDPAPAMLREFRRLAGERNVDVETVQAHAEDVPLPDSSFDVVASRLAPHHFSDISMGASELARVLRVGGWLAIIDLQGFDDPELDALNHELEVLHDPTHVRSYTTAAWRSHLTDAGLEVSSVDSDLTEREAGMPLSRWCAIANSGAEAESALRQKLSTLSSETLEGIRVRQGPDDFLIPVRTALIIARRMR